MTFDQPRFLYLLFLLIPIVILMMYRYGKQRKIFFTFSQEFDGREKSSFNRRSLVSSFFFIVFLVCIILALASPRFGYQNVTEYRRGLDVVFAMDVSRSMNADDAYPSRLIRSSLLAQELVKENPGTRFAVALAKGSGVLSIPLTDDAEAVLAVLRGISSSVITSSGTNIENLIRASLSAFQNNFPTQRRVILFSDGEAHEGNIQAILQNVEDADVSIISVGLGSTIGSSIPVENDVLRNPDSSIVMSSLHEDILIEAAEQSGGIYIDGNNQSAFAYLQEQVELLSSESISQGSRTEKKSWRHIFLILAVLAYGLSKLFDSTWRKKE